MSRRASLPARSRWAAASLVPLLLAACASPDRRPADDHQPTLASLAGRSVPIPRDGGVTPDQAQAAAAYRNFLAVGHDPAQRADVMRRLADLEMERADQASSEGGAVPDYRAAITQYEALLAEHPKARGNDRVLYQLARAQEQSGQLATALGTLNRLVQQHPDSAYREEVQFRRGEMLFATQQWEAAGEAFAAVLRGPANATFAERAAYMRGWSLFKQGRTEEALEPFFQVLDRKLARASPGPDPLAHLSRGERELLEDTQRVVSLSLAALKGPASIAPVVKNDRLRRDYEHLVHEQLAELYLKQERPKDAADTLAWYARERRGETPAPLLLERAITIHQQAGFPSLALQAERDFVASFGRESDFRRANPRAFEATQPAVKRHLMALARHHHAASQEARRAGAPAATVAEQVRLALAQYRELVRAFPRDADTPAQRFLMAELLFEDRQWAAAATEYETVAYDTPRAHTHPRAADAAYSALLSHAELVKAAPSTSAANSTPTPTATATPTSTSTATSPPSPARAAAQRAGVASALRFIDAFGSDARAAGVATNAAETLLSLGEGERAAQVARMAIDSLTRGPEARVASPIAVAGPAEQRVAYTVVGVNAFDRGRYAEAETAYAEALARAEPGSALAADLAERRAAAIYRQGDVELAAGRRREALVHLDRLATAAPASPLRALALFDAGTTRLALKDWEGAAAALEEFRRREPTHKLAAEVPAKLLLAYGELKRPALAAAEAERIAQATADPALKRAASWQAAELLAQAAELAAGTATGTSPGTTTPTATESSRARRDAEIAAANSFELYAQSWPQPLPAATEARWRAAALQQALGQPARAQALWRALREAERAGGDARTPRTREWSTLAALELAAPVREAYRSVRLVEPLAANLKLKKARFEAVLQAYASAAEEGQALGVTAATFQTAALYQDFGQALMGSERPRKLKALELEQYNVMLEEQAFPFEEKAIELHEANAARTAQGVWDEWVQRSLAELATVKPGRWARRERREAVTWPAAPAGADAALAQAVHERGRAALASLARAEAADASAQTRLQAAREWADALAVPGAGRAPLVWAPLHARAGLAWREAGRFDAAREAYERALELDPLHATTLWNLGVLEDLYLGHPAAAQALYARAAKALPPAAAAEIAQLDKWQAELKTRQARLAGAAAPARK